LFLGLVAIARDFLYILFADISIKQVFNFARDICYYYRGQLLPKTIRVLVICFYTKKSETRYQELLYILQDIINIKNLTENKLERETKILEFKIKKRFNKSHKK
jgi:hypothetical protein